MRALAAFAMRGRSQAAMVATTSAIGSLVFLPLAVVSGGTVALATLRKGETDGAVVMLVSALAAAVIVALLLGTPMPAFGYVLGLWLPMVLVGSVLRNTRALALGLAAAAGIGLVLIVILRITVPEEVWFGVLDRTLRAMLESQPGFDPSQAEPILRDAAALMPAAVGAMATATFAASLLLARAWQAALYNPGGFADEFRALRLGQAFAIATAAALALAMFVPAPVGLWARDVVAPLAIVCAIQALAVAHDMVALRGAGRVWLVLMYIAMALTLPQSVAVLAVLGIADSFVDLRRRARRT
ncbi:MAG: hypothetical protein KDG50_01000 [Chromatiales bacterium]|nr:hypothetical protein [Chromatiales bacterium]